MSGSRNSLKKSNVFNPRASNAWSSDDSKFGQRMLEKMGWKKGQGIGLNNQGIADNIKVRLKLDSKGLGYKIKEDEWLEIRSEFSDILSQLSQSAEDENEAVNKSKKSLEAVSQSSKTRVHYHKFTHGKDIAKYKKEDLIGILGKKELVEQSAIPDKEEFIQKGNMEEYFKNKRKLKTNPEKQSENESKTELSSDHNEEQDIPREEYADESNHFNDSVSKKKKSKKKSKDSIIDEFENNAVDSEKKCNVKRKRKKSACDQESMGLDTGVDEPAKKSNKIQINDEKCVDKKTDLTDDKNDCNEPKKSSKKKRKHLQNDTELSISNEPQNEDRPPNTTNELVQIRKKKKHIPDTPEKCFDEEESCVSVSKKKKRKREKTVDDESEAVESKNTEESFSISKSKLRNSVTEFMASVVDYNNCNNVEDYIEQFEKNKEELLNKYREKYKMKYLLSSYGNIEVYGDEFDGRKLDCKKAENEEKNTTNIHRKMSKAERIVAKARLLKSIKDNEVTHDFKGSNLTTIPGYGSVIC